MHSFNLRQQWVHNTLAQVTIKKRLKIIAVKNIVGSHFATAASVSIQIQVTGINEFEKQSKLYPTVSGINVLLEWVTFIVFSVAGNAKMK